MAKQDSTPPHPWLTAALEWGKRNGSWFIVHYGSPEWQDWANYFAEIGYMPKMFAVMTDRDHHWTAPTRWTNAFDMPLPAFERQEVPRLTASKPDAAQWPTFVGMRANLYVGHDKPGYAAMCERAKTADWKDWCTYSGHPKWGSGIMVPLRWYQDWQGRGRTSFVRPTASPQAILDRYAAEATQQREAAE